jgi:hypothetical protein
MSQSISAARTVILPLVIPEGQSLEFPQKDPADSLDFTLDITAWLADSGDTIASWAYAQSNINPQASALNIAKQSTTAPQLTLLIGAGIPATIYQIVFTVTLTSGRILNRMVTLPVNILAPASF